MDLKINKLMKSFSFLCVSILSLTFSIEGTDVMVHDQPPILRKDNPKKRGLDKTDLPQHLDSNKSSKQEKESLPKATEHSIVTDEESQWKEEARQTLAFLDVQDQLEKGEEDEGLE